METEDDIFTRAEDRAPNLGELKLVDFPDYICCSEVPKIKRDFCGDTFTQSSLHSAPECLKKQRVPSSQFKPPKTENEHDILFRPVKWRCKRTRETPRKTSEPSLGAPIGLSTSTFSMNFLETKPTDMSLQGFATTLIGYAEYFITPEVEWNETILNRILLEGQRLYNKSNESLSDSESLTESSIKRTFTLCNNTFHVLVNAPFLVGRVAGEGLSVPALHWGLVKFFKKLQFCLLQIGSWYVLLWQNADVFFVFDCFGRRPEDFRSDRKRGVAALICLRSLENVSHLLLNLSGVQPDKLFTMRHLQLKSLIPCGGKPAPEIVDRTNQYEVMHPDYAVLRASIHLGSHCFGEIRHRHSLPVAIAAIINAKIDPTPVWDRTVLDKVLKLGAHLYKQWTQCDISIDLGIQDVPSEFIFGQFTVQIAVNTFAECGLWRCTPNYRSSDLSKALRRAFVIGGNLVLQIQERSYAIWKKGTFYFLLDPFSHRCSLGKEKLTTGSVRMCSGIDRLCCVITQSLLDIFEESKFLILLVKIIHLEELAKIKQNRKRASAPCMCLATPQTDVTAEVASINESVLGPDDYVCAEEPPLPATDAADLDSPGLSQTRLEDYTDLRRDFVEESESGEEDDDDLNLDELVTDDAGVNKTDESDGDDTNKGQVKKTKRDKKASRKNATAEKAGGDTSVRDVERDEDETRGDDNYNDEQQPKNDDEQPGDEEQPKVEEQSKDVEQPKDEKQPKHEEPTKPGLPTEEQRRETKEEEALQDQDAAPTDDQSKPVDSSKHEARDSTKDTRPSIRPQRRQRRKERDDSSSDEKPPCGVPAGCIPNSYPGFTEDPQDLAVVGSESGSYESLCSLLKSAFRCADRVLTMTPWGNYVAFRANGIYFVFDGCTCNLRSIRHLDLSIGTAGLLCFSNMHELICYIESSKDAPKPSKSTNRDAVEQICNKYCGR